MSRRTRARTKVSSRWPRWHLAAAAALVVATGAWWVFMRDGESGTAGGSLASYRPPDVHALAVHPRDPSVLVFGSHRGLLISRDAGRTWSPIGPAGDAMGLAMPAGSNAMYAAGHDVFLRSDDGGRTWSSARPALPGTDIHGFGAGVAGRLYAFVNGHGLFRSDDGGSRWARAASAPASTMSMAIAGAADQDIIFAATMEGVQRSRDAGTTWERVAEVGSATIGAAGSRVYAVAGGRLLVSSDGGVHWEQRSFGAGNAVLIAPAPSEPDTVFIVAEDLGVWRSRDTGRTWERTG